MVKSKFAIPQNVSNWIDGAQIPAMGEDWIEKIRPSDEERLCQFARSRPNDIELAVGAAQKAQPAWEETPGVERGMTLFRIVRAMQDMRDMIAEAVSQETGKSLKDARVETDSAIALGLFYASEGQRLYGRTVASAQRHREVWTIRQPIGVAGLIAASNTPIANVAWKVFPALICGNTAVLKAAEDTPITAWLFTRLAHESGLPPGVLNTVQGLGREAGAPLIDHPNVGVISFTGSTRVGLEIAASAAKRLCRLSLELGGKNPMIICDDADLENAVEWTVRSAFSNAGQRCAAASRIIVFENIYERFRGMILARTAALRVGSGDDDDFGPVVHEKRCSSILSEVAAAQVRGARLLCGGRRLKRPGFYIEPTVLEDVMPSDPLSRTEIFGPVTCLYRVEDFAGALQLANNSPYGLTSCIHTQSLDRAMAFSRRIQAGVVMVNVGTFGSEPHMPFGGSKLSGNGSREPGTEALNVYTELKDVYIQAKPA